MNSSRSLSEKEIHFWKEKKKVYCEILSTGKGKEDGVELILEDRSRENSEWRKETIDMLKKLLTIGQITDTRRIKQFEEQLFTMIPSANANDLGIVQVSLGDQIQIARSVTYKAGIQDEILDGTEMGAQMSIQEQETGIGRLLDRDELRDLENVRLHIRHHLVELAMEIGCGDPQVSVHIPMPADFWRLDDEKRELKCIEIMCKTRSQIDDLIMRRQLGKMRDQIDELYEPFHYNSLLKLPTKKNLEGVWASDNALLAEHILSSNLVNYTCFG